MSPTVLRDSLLTVSCPYIVHTCTCVCKTYFEGFSVKELGRESGERERILGPYLEVYEEGVGPRSRSDGPKFTSKSPMTHWNLFSGSERLKVNGGDISLLLLLP